MPLDLTHTQPQRRELGRFDLDALKRGLADRAHEWVPPLFPRGWISKNGREWRLANIHGDAPRHDGSCKIDLEGEKAGCWYDHSEDTHGDQLDTLEQGTGLRPPALYERAAELVGTAKPKANGHAKSRRTDAEIVRDIAFIRQHCVPAAGTLAETYLNSRGLDLPDCPDLLFHPSLTDWDEKRGRPAMVTILRRPDNGEETGGIWRTYLADDGTSKADMPMAKLAYGACAGGVAMLMPMPADGTLGVAEGQETAIAAAKIFGVPVCAGMSAGGVRGFILPPRLKHLLIFADTGKDGENAATDLRQRALDEAGIVARIYQPRHGDDFADDLQRGECRAADYPEWQPPGPVEPDEAAVAEAEIIPPARTIDQIFDEARTLTRDITPMTVDRLNGVLRHIAEAKLDPANISMMMSEIKNRTGIGIGDLRQALKEMQQEVRGAVAPIDTSEVTKLCRRYVYVQAVGAFWDRLTRTIVPMDAVRYAHWAEMPLNDFGEPSDPRDVMVKGTFGMTVDRVDGITFMPASSEIVTENGAKYLNVWTAPDIEPKPGDASPFLNHIEYVLDSDPVATDYLLHYFAHLVQKPWIKIKSAPLIIGAPGIGKSLIGERMATIIGRQNATAIEESNLCSPFNEWMDGKLLVIIHELMTFGRQATMNRLKSCITELMVRINRKNVNTYDYPNRANFLMFSNYEDAAKIEEGDRRYFIWISKAKKRTDAYYSELYSWFENGGDEVLLHYLLTRDITAFNPNAQAPATASKDVVVDLSRGAIDAYLKEAFEARQAPFQHDLIVINDVIDFLRETKRMTISHTVLSKFLRSVDAVPLGQKRLTTGETSPRLSFWALRDTERYAKVPDGQFGQIYRDQVAAPLSLADKDAIFTRIVV